MFFFQEHYLNICITILTFDAVAAHWCGSWTRTAPSCIQVKYQPRGIQTTTLSCLVNLFWELHARLLQCVLFLMISLEMYFRRGWVLRSASSFKDGCIFDQRYQRVQTYIPGSSLYLGSGCTYDGFICQLATSSGYVLFWLVRWQSCLRHDDHI